MAWRLTKVHAIFQNLTRWLISTQPPTGEKWPSPVWPSVLREYEAANTTSLRPHACFTAVRKSSNVPLVMDAWQPSDTLAHVFTVVVVGAISTCVEIKFRPPHAIDATSSP